jgi:hypothetical protein
MADAKLTDEVRAFVVQSLAMFDTPSTVAAAVKAEFGIEISRQAVENYDPTKKAGKSRPFKRWKQLFEETRKTFLEDTATIGISHRTVRLRALQRMVDKAETQGNMVLAASLLRQAAEEMGGGPNRREHTGKDGTPLPMSPTIIYERDDGRRVANE